MVGSWAQGFATCLVIGAAGAMPAYADDADGFAANAALPAPASGVLPPYDFAAGRGIESMVVAAGLPVADVRFLGRTAVPEAELDAAVGGYLGRSLGLADLAGLQDAVTAVYVDRGYVTSGAAVKSLADGVLTVDLVEGRVAAVEVETDGRLRSQYVARYLEGFGPMQPVNVLDIERRLQTLQGAPYVSRVEAQLVPGERIGESILRVRTFEESPWSARLEVSNHQSPAIGEWNGRFVLGARNLSGRADDLSVSARSSEGIVELSLDYDMPLNARDTRLGLFAIGSDSEIVTEPFDDLGIEAETRTFGARLSHPWRRSPAGHSRLSLSLEWRESETFLLGSGFSFVEGPEEGRAQIAALRLAWEELHRGPTNVLAARLELSVGLDAFGATETAGGAPDGVFEKLVGQVQWARRLPWLASQLVLRADAQVTEDPLLGMEQMPLGGRWTVRGYRENTLIRDKAVSGSVEWRVPVWRDVRGASILELRPFVDAVWSANVNRDEVGPRTLYSAGLGAVWQPLPQLQAEVYWGEALNDVDYPGAYSVQDDGVHARLSWSLR